MNEHDGIYSAKIAEVIRAFLDEQGWKYSFSEEEGTFSFLMKGTGILKYLPFRIEAGSKECTVYAFSPIGFENMDDVTKSRMTVFLYRIAQLSREDIFLLDKETGEIYFKCRIRCEKENELSGASISKAINAAWEKFNQYIPAIGDMVTTGKLRALEDNCLYAGEEGGNYGGAHFFEDDDDEEDAGDTDYFDELLKSLSPQDDGDSSGCLEDRKNENADATDDNWGIVDDGKEEKNGKHHAEIMIQRLLDRFGQFTIAEASTSEGKTGSDGDTSEQAGRSMNGGDAE
ncbi:MAG: hypothetical protein ACI4ET_06890 [Bilifractor sp.]